MPVSQKFQSTQPQPEPLAHAIEQITWFPDKILFEVVREETEDDIVEWSTSMPRKDDGDFDQRKFDTLTRQMHNNAYRLSQQRRGQVK